MHFDLKLRDLTKVLVVCVLLPVDDTASNEKKEQEYSACLQGRIAAYKNVIKKSLDL